jgi:hypothetical protein
MSDIEIINQLTETFGEQIVVTEKLPKTYCPGGIEAVKAIYLGCDPTNTAKNFQFEHAFSHGCADKGFAPAGALLKMYQYILIQTAFSFGLPSKLRVSDSKNINTGNSVYRSSSNGINIIINQSYI